MQRFFSEINLILKILSQQSFNCHIELYSYYIYYLQNKSLHILYVEGKWTQTNSLQLQSQSKAAPAPCIPTPISVVPTTLRLFKQFCVKEKIHPIILLTKKIIFRTSDNIQLPLDSDTRLLSENILSMSPGWNRKQLGRMHQDLYQSLSGELINLKFD